MKPVPLEVSSVETLESSANVLHMPPTLQMSEEQFFEFCGINRDWRIERTAEGVIEIMPPTGWETGNRNAIITAQVTMWSLRDGTGAATDSSGGFKLPSGATRAPDAAWVKRERLSGLSEREKQRFLPLCPDFAIELRSPTDTLAAVQAKMREYIENGARLGWLIDPIEKQVHVYRTGVEVEYLGELSELSGEPELPGFVLDLKPVWEPRL